MSRCSPNISPLDSVSMKNYKAIDYTCPKCKVDLVAGIFLDDGHATDDPCCIYSRQHWANANQIEIGGCWKCPKCGFSMQVELD